MTGDVAYRPLAGSPHQLGELAAAAARSATALASTRTDLHRLDGAMASQRSAAIDAAREVAAGLTSHVDLSEDVLRTVAATLLRRSSGLAREQHDAAAAISRRDDALARLARAQTAEGEALRRSALDPALTHTAAEVWAARADADLARADLTAAEADWLRAREAKEAGSRWAAAQIDALQHVRAVRLAAAAGIGAAAFAVSWERGRALATSFQGAGGRIATLPPDPESGAPVRALGEDPVAWRAFWEHVDPHDVLGAFAGTDPDGETADALRDGVEIVTAQSTAAEQGAFGRQLVEGLGAPRGDSGSRAALLAGMLGGAVPAALHAGAADALAERRADPGVVPFDDTTLTAPLTLVVARGLAQDPERALEHLAGSSPDVATQRARFWFGGTPRLGWSDGGTAVTGLLATAVAAGTAPTSSATRRNEAAAAISAATPELVRTTGLLSSGGSLPPQVETNVVRAFAPYVPSFGDTVSPDDARSGLATDPGYVEPDLQPATLCAVIDSTSRTSHGTEAWLATTDDYRTDVAARLDVAPENTGERSAVIVGASKDAAVVLGATEADVLQAASARQGYGSAAVWGAGTGLSIATLGASVPLAAGVLGVTTALPFASELTGVDAVSQAHGDLEQSGAEVTRRYHEELVAVAAQADGEAGYETDDPHRLPVWSGVDLELTTAYLEAADIDNELSLKPPTKENE